jgi:hypothetical protein
MFLELLMTGGFFVPPKMTAVWESSAQNVIDIRNLPAKRKKDFKAFANNQKKVRYIFLRTLTTL